MVRVMLGGKAPDKWDTIVEELTKSDKCEVDAPGETNVMLAKFSK